MGLLDWPFRSREVRWTLKALDEVLDEAAPSSVNASRAIVRAECRRLIKNSDQTAYQIRVNGHDPGTLAASLAFGVAERLLTSGQHHCHRGRLTSTGHGLRSLARRLLEVQVRFGALDQDAADRVLREIEDEVRSVG